MVKYKKKIFNNICIRALVLLLVVGLTYGIMMCCYKKQGDPKPCIIGEISLENNDKMIIVYENNENNVDYYGTFIFSSESCDMQIICYGEAFTFKENNEKIKIFTSNEFLETFEFDIIYNGIRKHYSISN